MKLINAINKVKENSLDSRRTINGIYLDKENQKIVATNGNALVALVPDEPIKESKLLSIPKLAGKTIDLDQDSLTLTTDKGLSTTAELKDGTYPDWRQVIRDKEPTISIGISLELLQNVVNTLLDARTEKRASSKVSDTIFRIDIVDSNTPVKVSVLGHESFGIIMPARYEA